MNMESLPGLNGQTFCDTEGAKAHSVIGIIQFTPDWLGAASQVCLYFFTVKIGIVASYNPPLHQKGSAAADNGSSKGGAGHLGITVV